MPDVENGLALEQMRTSRGILLEQIVQTTKISVVFLRAIEKEEFGKLPGGIFDKSYLKQYANAAGISEEIVFNLYHAYRQSLEQSEERAPSAAEVSSAPRWLQPLIQSLRSLFWPVRERLFGEGGVLRSS